MPKLTAWPVPVVALTEVLIALEMNHRSEYIRECLPWHWGDANHTLIAEDRFFDGVSELDITRDAWLEVVPRGTYINLEN